MPPLPSRLSSPVLDLDKAPSAKHPAAFGGNRRPGGAAVPPARRARPSAGRVVFAFVLLAALAAGAWFALERENGPLAGGTGDLSGFPENVRPVVEYLRPTEAEARLWFDAVRSSSYVREKWSKLADAVDFEYVPDDDSLNAYAYFAGGDPSKPGIRLLGGWVRMSRLVGALALLDGSAGADAKSHLKRAADAIESTGDLSEEAVVELLESSGVGLDSFRDVAAVSTAKGLAEGICKATLAHEFGHVAGGHSLGADPNRTVSQNEEKQADLFASSVAASVANGQQMLVGQILTWYTLALAEETNPEAELFRTHPFSADRLRAAVDANKNLAASLGITPADAAALADEASGAKSAAE